MPHDSKCKWGRLCWERWNWRRDRNNEEGRLTWQWFVYEVGDVPELVLFPLILAHRGEHMPSWTLSSPWSTKHWFTRETVYNEQENRPRLVHFHNSWTAHRNLFHIWRQLLGHPPPNGVTMSLSDGTARRYRRLQKKPTRGPDPIRMKRTPRYHQRYRHGPRLDFTQPHFTDESGNRFRIAPEVVKKVNSLSSGKSNVIHIKRGKDVDWAALERNVRWSGGVMKIVLNPRLADIQRKKIESDPTIEEIPRIVSIQVKSIFHETLRRREGVIYVSSPSTATLATYRTLLDSMMPQTNPEELALARPRKFGEGTMVTYL